MRLKWTPKHPALNEAAEVGDFAVAYLGGCAEVISSVTHKPRRRRYVCIVNGDYRGWGDTPEQAIDMAREWLRPTWEALDKNWTNEVE